MSHEPPSGTELPKAPAKPLVFSWQLRQLMAAANMFQTTELIAPLAAQGVELSREQVFRLVTKAPERLSLKVLAALCAIFDCTPDDLLLAPRRSSHAPH